MISIVWIISLIILFLLFEKISLKVEGESERPHFIWFAIGAFILSIIFYALYILLK